MRFLPVFLDVAAGSVALIGAGPQAQNKLRLLRAAGARIRWYAGADMGGIDAFDPAQADFSGFMAVVSAAGGAIDEAVAARARAVGVPVNVVDRPDLSTFVFPAIIDRGDVVVAVGTGGASPVLARRLRERIEALLPARIGDLAALLGRYRARFARTRHGSRSARRFWEQVVDGPIGAAALAGRSSEAEAALARAVDETATPEDSTGLVHFVDAGSGDPDLLTLRALRVLQNADVIVYDDSVDRAVLDRARRDAERVFVGRRRRRPGFDQVALAGLVAKHARAGQNVTCLSAGNALAGVLLQRLRPAGLSVATVPGVASVRAETAEIAA